MKRYGGISVEEIRACMRRRTKLLYDMNCIRHYIEGGDYDSSLKQAWAKYNKELEGIDEHLKDYVKPHYDALLEEKKMYEGKIKEHKEHIKQLREEVSYITDLLKHCRS